MLTSLLLYLIYGLVFLITSPFRLLADVSLPSAQTAAISSAAAGALSLQQIWPVDTLFAACTLTLTIILAIFTFKGLMWALKKIPGIN